MIETLSNVVLNRYSKTDTSTTKGKANDGFTKDKANSIRKARRKCEVEMSRPNCLWMRVAQLFKKM